MDSGRRGDVWFEGAGWWLGVGGQAVQCKNGQAGGKREKLCWRGGLAGQGSAGGQPPGELCEVI